MSPVEGRFETIRSAEGITGIVDYAHTPDALKNVLDTISSIRTRSEQLITVVGAGGDRDKAKRPVMARICSEKSDRLILTSDNPRSEDPEEILEQMKSGISAENKRKVIIITDRKEAIKTACHLANTGDIILVAGKGHEKYQEIKGIRYPFDDLQVLGEIFDVKNEEN
jgi:UDP-N-acetylmuramoyl-L-alanyl-D-glutamate--2,6-diaminopimelate ligase